MTLTYKKFGWDRGSASLAAIAPLKRPVRDQSQSGRIVQQSIVTVVEEAIVEYAVIERTLTPSMIIGLSAAIDQFTVPDMRVSSPAPLEVERRAAALKSVFGIWKDRQDAPEDGLVFQQETRAEWR